MSALKVCLPHKRKRGRPRADEPKDMKDFDVALIHEFKRRPAFYDRTHPQYRNREHLDPQWTVLAHTLGYTVPVVKNRMMQLRSRYSLEKRRLEAVKEQCGEDAEITSPWALYEEMDFLGEHIKGRLNVTLKKEGGDSTMQSSESDDNDDSSAAIQNKLVNGYATTQTLPTSSSTPIQQIQVSVNANTVSSNLTSTPSTILYQQQQQHQQQIQQQSVSHQQQQPPTQQLQKNHSSNANHNQLHQQRHEHQQEQHQHQRYHHHHHHTDDYFSSTNDLSHSIGERRIGRHEKVLDLLHSTSSDSKFVAFGQFISSSLIEMQETDALRLVEKFTTELIQTVQADRSMIVANNSNSSSHNNSNNNINNNNNINHSITNVTHDSI